MQQGLQEHQRRAARIEELIEAVAAFPDSPMRATTEELIQALLDLYGDGLGRVLDITMQTNAAGHRLVEAFTRDDLLASLFMLHGLHPLDLETRVVRALDDVRPYLKSHGGNVELIKLENGRAYLRLEGSCNGCSSSTVTLKTTIEEAIYRAAPDLDGLEVEGTVEAAARQSIPVAFIPRKGKESKLPKEQVG